MTSRVVIEAFHKSALDSSCLNFFQRTLTGMDLKVFPSETTGGGMLLTTICPFCNFFPTRRLRKQTNYLAYSELFTCICMSSPPTGKVPWEGTSLDEVRCFYREKQCLEISIPEEVHSGWFHVLAV